MKLRDHDPGRYCSTCQSCMHSLISITSTATGQMACGLRASKYVSVTSDQLMEWFREVGLLTAMITRPPMQQQKPSTNSSCMFWRTTLRNSVRRLLHMKENFVLGGAKFFEDIMVTHSDKK